MSHRTDRNPIPQRALRARRRLATALIAAATCCAAEADVVKRRGAEQPISGELVRLDPRGALMRTELGAEHLVPLDRVRSVYTERHRPDLESMLELAEDLWRARTRVERRDMVMAEPLLERLYARYQDESHETALLVAEGLLRCRLARGRQVDAMLPCLDVLRLRRAGVTTDAYHNLPLVIDPEHELCKALAPAWVDLRGLARLLASLESYDASGDEVVEAIAALYHRIASIQLGRPVGPLRAGELPDHEGVDLLVDMARALDPDTATRVSAREHLRRRAARDPGWVEAWSRFAVGRSLLRESGAGRRERGLIQLAYVPARFGSAQPFLAGLAIDEMARGLEAMGDHDGALALREELLRRYPAHPILAAGSRRSTATPPDSNRDAS